MQVFCTDGTVFRCGSYEVTQHGVQLYGSPPDETEERYSDDPEMMGYVPHDRLWYILPDGVRSAAPTLAQSQGTPGRPPGSVTPQGGQSPGARQQRGGHPARGSPGRTPPESGGPP